MKQAVVACLWLFMLLRITGGIMPAAYAAVVHNREAVIPPQCYTRTEGRYNPCYVCHQTHSKGTRINRMQDGDIQGEYSFSSLGEINQWSNLFKPRQSDIQAVSDEQVLAYVRQENYSSLLQPVSGGYQPDLQRYANPAEAFDARGMARDGSGWIAFNYKPLPSTFWPTNGSFDDVLIRLPSEFRQQADGSAHSAVYWLNLSLVEMAIKDLEQISIPLTDETQLGLDLDGDGTITQASTMLRRDQYLGAASNVPVLRQQYPVGTEFLHSVRYLDVDEFGNVVAAPRFKELRYARKTKAHSDAALAFIYNQEHREKAQERLPGYTWAKPVGQAGLNNKMGWVIQGWIEDASGSLRPQSYEEHFYCMGCHTTVGTTVDQTFAFPRKVTGAKGWGYINLKGMPDVPNMGEQEGEILTYFRRVGGGDEFRQNLEILQRWFGQNGTVHADKVRQADVHELLTPSADRALALNKAYQQIVLEQSFYLGRDAVLGDAVNVYREVQPERAPVLPLSNQYHYDIRLDWSGALFSQANDASMDDASDGHSDTASGGVFNWLYLVIFLAIGRVGYLLKRRFSDRRSATTPLDTNTTHPFRN